MNDFGANYNTYELKLEVDDALEKTFLTHCSVATFVYDNMLNINKERRSVMKPMLKDKELVNESLAFAVKYNVPDTVSKEYVKRAAEDLDHDHSVRGLNYKDQRFVTMPESRSSRNKKYFSVPQPFVIDNESKTITLLGIGDVKFIGDFTSNSRIFHVNIRMKMSGWYISITTHAEDYVHPRKLERKIDKKDKKKFANKAKRWYKKNKKI